MFKYKEALQSEKVWNKKGVALLIVLGMLLVVILLANVILSIILSHSRLTHHQISRIQAYYAAMAGVNYALEMLRIGSPTGWTVSSCPSPNGCLHTDTDFPHTIENRQVRIVLRPAGSAGCITPPGGSACVSVTATYTYTP